MMQETKNLFQDKHDCNEDCRTPREQYIDETYQHYTVHNISYTTLYVSRISK
jgi:hypothetical protein